jgi:hypothetical protein
VGAATKVAAEADRGGTAELERGIFAGEALEFRRIPIMRIDRSLLDLHRSCAAGTLDLRRPFRCDVVWRLDAQARLVESVLLRFPLPPVHIAESRNGGMHLIDGLQRLSSLFAFLEGQIALTELRLLPELNGKRFAALPIRLRRRYEDTLLTVMVLGSDADPALLVEVYNRMNAWAPLRDGEAQAGG